MSDIEIIQLRPYQLPGRRNKDSLATALRPAPSPPAQGSPSLDGPTSRAQAGTGPAKRGPSTALAEEVAAVVQVREVAAGRPDHPSARQAA